MNGIEKKLEKRGDKSMKRIKRNYLMVSVLAMTVFLLTAYSHCENSGGN